MHCDVVERIVVCSDDDFGAPNCLKLQHGHSGRCLAHPLDVRSRTAELYGKAYSVRFLDPPTWTQSLSSFVREDSILAASPSAVVCPLRYSQRDYEWVQNDFFHESIGSAYRSHILILHIGFSHTAFAGLNAASRARGE